MKISDVVKREATKPIGWSLDKNPEAPQGRRHERAFALEGLKRALKKLEEINGQDLVWPLGAGRNEDDPVFKPLMDALEKKVMDLMSSVRKVQQKLKGAL